MQNQLQLESYYLDKFHINWRPPEVPDVQVAESEITLDYDVAVHNSEKHRYKFTLRVQISEIGKEQRDVGYVVDAEIVGFFAFDEECDKSTRPSLIRLNGVSLLYSTLRGLVGGISGTFRGGNFVLPTISAKQVVTKVEAAKKAAQPTTIKTDSKSPSLH